MDQLKETNSELNNLESKVNDLIKENISIKKENDAIKTSSARTAVGTKVIFSSSSSNVFFAHTNFKLVFFPFHRCYFEHIQRNYGLFLGEHIKPRQLHSFLLFDLSFENLGHFIEHVIIEVHIVPFRNLMKFKLLAEFHCCK